MAENFDITSIIAEVSQISSRSKEYSNILPAVAISVYNCPDLNKYKYSKYFREYLKQICENF